MSNTLPLSAQSEVRGAILGRLESLYSLALENNSLNLCVRILDMMAKLNGLYEPRKKKPGTEPLTLDEFTEDHLAHLMEEITLLEKTHEKKCLLPLQVLPQQSFSRENFSQETAPQDTLYWETVSREALSQNISADGSISQDLNIKGLAPKDFNKMFPQKR